MTRRRVKFFLKNLFAWTRTLSQMILILFLIVWTLGIFYWLPFMWPAKAATFQMQTGYYWGSGTDNLSITGVGFQPELLFVSGESPPSDVVMVWKSSAMAGENTAKANGADIATDAIQSLDSDGFTVGTNAAVNSSEERYTWIAFRGSDCTATGTMCVGTYTGDGTTPRTITTGFQPAMAFTKNSAGALRGVWATSDVSANQYFFATGGGIATGSTIIQSLASTGFTVGSNDVVNKSGSTFWYFAFKSVAGAMKNSTYTGDGTASQSITGVGFQPSFVWDIRSTGGADSFNVIHTKESYKYSNTTDASGGSSLITSLDADGFTVGTNSNVATTYYYVAWGGAPEPTLSGNFPAATGSYSGTGVAQSVTSLSFRPDLVIIKHTDQATDQTAVFKTKLMYGDSTASFTGGVNFTGGITSLDSTGFTVGTNATVNTSGDTYYWEAFGNAYDPMDKAGATDFAVGAYQYTLGDVIDDNNINRIGFQPDLVVIKDNGGYQQAVWRTSVETTDNSYYFGATADASNLIQTFNSDGFQVGNGTPVRGNTPTYWFAFKASAGKFAVNSYTGTGVARGITSTGFQPDLLWVKRSTAVAGVSRPSSLTGTANQYFTNTPNGSGIITSLDATGFSLGTDTTVNANTGSYRYAAWNFRTYTQSAYRWFANADSTNVGSAAAAQDTQYTMTADGEAVRLRMLVHVAGGNLYASDENFKLQYVDKGGGTCASPSGGTPASWTDVDTTTSIAYKDNATPTDGSALTTNGSDPTHSSDTVQAQTYEELNNFTNSQSAVTIGQDAKWDFALYDKTAANSTVFCFRAVLSDGTALSTYSSYPTLGTLANTAPVATTPTSIAQATDDTGQITFATAISDADLNNTKLKVEYSEDGGSTWYDPDLISVTPSSGSVDIDDAQTYQIGSVNAIDTSTGSITLTIVWDTQSASNGNGSLNNTGQTDIKVRVTPNDSTIDGTAQASANFSLDNLNPTASGNLTVGGRATDSITYTLGAAGSDTNISSYKIYYKQAASGVAETDTLHTTIATAAYVPAATTQIGSLSANTQYVVNIWTYDSYGNKERATELAAYTNAVQVTSLSVADATSTTQYQETLTWAYASGTPNGLKIEQDTGCDGYETTVYDNASVLPTSPYTVTGLTANTCYQFRLTSYNVAGNRNGTSMPETSQITTPPAQAIGLGAASQTTTQIVWDWNDVSGATDYRVYLSTGVLVSSVGSATSQYSHNGLTINTQYSVYVRAVNANGEGIASITASAFTASGSGASIPVSLSHDASSQTTAAMKWTWASGGSQQDYYASTSSPADNSAWTTNTFWNQSGLSANTAVVLSVKARDSGLVETSVAQTTAYTSQNTPTGISKSSLATDSISLAAGGTFTNLTSASSGLYFSNSTNLSNSGWLQTNSWQNSSLAANTSYTYTVKARNGDSDETSTATASYYTAQNTPTAITSSSTQTTSVTITATGTFTNLTSATSGLYFENVTAGTNSGWVQTNSWLSSNLTSGVAYQFRVKARNGDSVETALTATTGIITLSSSPLDDTANGSGAPTVYQCGDGLDNDGDGAIDLNDLGCSSATDNDESDEVKVLPTLDEPKDGLITNNNKPYIIGATTTGTMLLDIFIDSSKASSLTSQADKSFVWKVVTALNDGSHTVYVVANNQFSNKHTITVDTQAPNSPQIEAVTIKEQAEKDKMVTAKLEINGQAQTGTKYVVLYLNGSILIDTFETIGTSWTYTWNNNFKAGEYGVSAKAIDSAQNISVTSARKTFQLALNEKKENTDEEIAEKKAADEEAAKKEAEKKAANEATAKKEAEKKAADEAAAKKEAEKKAADEATAKKEAEKKGEEVEVPLKPVQPIVPIDPIIPIKPIAPIKPVAPIEVETNNDATDQPIQAEKPIKNKTADEIIIEIKNKEAWDKSSNDQQTELIYDVDQIMKSEFVKDAVSGLSQIISNISGQDLSMIKKGVEQTVKTVVRTTKQVQQKTIDNPTVEKINKVSKQAVLTTVAATSVASVATIGATGASGATALTYLQFIFTQPLLLFMKRKKRGYGVIYNSITKQPVDLAVVRVYEAGTKRLVRTRVTDTKGRYEFILNPGKYYLSVEKKDFKFPSTLLAKSNVDGQHENLYYGNEIEVTEKDAINRPIPLDPNKAVKTIKNEMRLHFTKQTQFALTLVGPALAIVSFVVNPQFWVGGVVVAQLVLYGIFKKLALAEKPSSWGSVKDAEKKNSLAKAIVRVFDVKFNKLLDSQVTDREGRYAFLVGNEQYYMTAQKAGYYERRSERYDLAGKESGYLVENFNLKPHHL
ncbi:MAG: hypothetical protein AAB766_04065, partial [Patescibacteria group bacterium]